MTVLFGDPGGEHYFSLSTSGAVSAGWWTTRSGTSTINTGQAGRQAASDGKIYAINLPNGGDFVSKTFASGSFSRLIIGCAFYASAAPVSATPIQTKLVGAIQTQLKIDASGHLFFDRNGTTIGATSTVTVPPGWNYYEADITYATTAVGTANCWLNGVQVVTNSGNVQTANTTAAADTVVFTNIIAGATCNLKDIYILDGNTSPNNAHFGDVNVSVANATLSGTNQAWTQGISTGVGTSVASLAVTSVATGGVYTYTNPGGVVANQLIGYNVQVNGFVTNPVNNCANATITANSTTTFTVSGVTTIAETHAATMTPVCLWQDGLNHLGTWPDGDPGYLFSGTANQISDFKHTALSLTGTLLSVIHVSYVRKDDAGSRLFRQVCVSGGTTETNGTDISATNSYLYYTDVLDVDPNTSAQWTLANYNNATFGVKEIT